jgi:hypothetical protein
MQQPGLRERHRDKNGEISRKHGNTLVGTLRKTYGRSFAAGCDDREKLSEVLHRLDEHSLSQITMPAAWTRFARKSKSSSADRGSASVSRKTALLDLTLYARIRFPQAANRLAASGVRHG